MVRKELAGLDPHTPARDEFDRGIYAPEMTAHTYAECLRRAEELVFDGARIIVDANFRTEDQRRLMLDAAARWCVPTLLLVCKASPDVARQRSSARRGDASDADVEIYEKLADGWQKPLPETLAALREIDTDGAPGQSLVQAIESLQHARLMP